MNSQPGWRRGTVGAVVTAVLMLGLMVSPVLRPAQTVASAAGSQSAAGKGVNEATVAKKLAAKVYGAHSAKARYAALLSVMKTLGIGVYTAKLKRLVHGAERGPKDFYLYDFEVKMLADGLAQKQLQSTDQLAQLLNEVGIKSPDKPLSADLLRQALLLAVRSAAAHPTDPYSLRPLLLRELGLRHDKPYDLLKDVPLQQLQFDRLGSLLILADVLVPILRSIEYGSAHNDWMGTSKDTHPPADPAAPCVGQTWRAIQVGGAVGAAAGAWAFGDKILDAIRETLNLTTEYVQVDLGNGLLKLAGSVAAVVTELIDILHMNLLAIWVDASFSTIAKETHWGPPGHPAEHGIPGQEMRFTLKVVMTKDVGELVINCGALIGFKFPRRGPIPGVSVNWIHLGLGDQGTISYVPETVQTGDDGTSTLVFKPKDEIVPGFGQEVEKTGTVRAIADYQSAFAPNLLGLPISLGDLVQFLSPKGDSSDWSVYHHVPRGFKFDAQIRSWIDEDQQDDTGDATDGPGIGDAYVAWEITGRVCGEDPYKKPWDVKVHVTLDDPGDPVTRTFNPPEPYGADGSVQWLFAPYQTIEVPDLLGEKYGVSIAPNWIDVSVVPGPPLVLRVTNHPSYSQAITASDGTLRPDQPRTDVPIQDDPTCPPPTP